MISFVRVRAHSRSELLVGHQEKFHLAKGSIYSEGLGRFFELRDDSGLILLVYGKLVPAVPAFFLEFEANFDGIGEILADIMW